MFITSFSSSFDRAIHWTLMEPMVENLKTYRMRESPQILLNPTAALPYVRDIVLAASQLLARGIVHMDMKLDNLLLDAADRVRLCDFGAAVKCMYPSSADGAGPTDWMQACSRRKFHGNPAHFAPEVHRLLSTPSAVSGKEPILLRVDKQPVFDCGRCIYELITAVAGRRMEERAECDADAFLKVKLQCDEKRNNRPE
jgi:serine/threonine protein kinase